MKIQYLFIASLFFTHGGLQAIKTNIPPCRTKKQPKEHKKYPEIISQNKEYGTYLEQLTPQTYRITTIKDNVYIPQKIFTSEYKEKNFRFLSTNFLYSETYHNIIIRSRDGIIWYIFRKKKNSGAQLSSFALAPTKGYLVTLYNDHKLHIKSSSDGKTKATISGVDHFINGQHTQDESFLAVFLKNGDGEIWNMHSAKKIAQIKNINEKLQ